MTRQLARWKKRLRSTEPVVLKDGKKRLRTTEPDPRLMVHGKHLQTHSANKPIAVLDIHDVYTIRHTEYYTVSEVWRICNQ